SVSLRTTRAEVGAAEALAQGQADLAATSLESMLRFGSRPTTPVPRLVFGLTAAPPVALLAPLRAGEPPSGAKLAGLKIGLSAPGVPEHTWLIGILDAAGVSAAQVQMVSIGSRALEAGLESGDLGAGMLADPAATRVQDSGRVAVLADLRPPAGVGQALRGPTVSAAAFVRRGAAVAQRGPRGPPPALRAATERTRTMPPADLASRLPTAVVGLPEEFGVRLIATRDSYLEGGQVTPDQLRRTIDLIRAHQPLPVALKLPRPEEML